MPSLLCGLQGLSMPSLLCGLQGLSMYTVFSASNYSDGANDAAVLHWRCMHRGEYRCGGILV